MQVMVSGVAVMTLVGWVGDGRDPTRFLRVLEGKLGGSSGHLQSLISTCKHAAGFKLFVKLDFRGEILSPVTLIQLPFPVPRGGSPTNSANTLTSLSARAAPTDLCYNFNC